MNVNLKITKGPTYEELFNWILGYVFTFVIQLDDMKDDYSATVKAIKKLGDESLAGVEATYRLVLVDVKTAKESIFTYNPKTGLGEEESS